MRLTPGTRLGVYEVTAQIGEGGMGQVYLAADTKLKRQVAIKILPPSLAADPDRLARFQREAEVLASLNHPNIAIIYGLETGQTGQSVPTALPAPPALPALPAFIVMELIEGEDLSQRIARGALPLDEALPIAKQIADALEAAHEKGIIHRDLKPANIKLRSDGVVKVLDFGLAKAMVSDAAPDLSRSPTLSLAATQAGMILGTAGYMSPEQAKGRAVDRRTDVWAFGAVLFEMLTGKRAFAGDDISDTLANVLKIEPDWTGLPAETPPRVRLALRACLQKDPKQRVGDVQSLRLALEGAFETIVAQPDRADTSPRDARSWWRRALPLAATALVVAAVAASAGWMIKPSEQRAVIRSVQALPDGLNLRSTGRRVVAISPDGRHFVYNAADGLHLRAIDTLDDRVISGSEEPLESPVFSPDGQSVVYFRDDQLRRLAIAGGTSVALVAATPPIGMSWGADGTIVYGQTDGIWQVSGNGGEPERLVATEPPARPHNPQRLPRGDWVLFSLSSPTGDDQIVIESLASKDRRVLLRGGNSARYLPTGHLLYMTSGVLYAVRFDVDRLQVTGGPVPVVEGVRRSVATLPRVGQFDVSDSGTLVYLPGPSRDDSQRTVALADRAGTVTRVGSPGRYEHVRISPDGTQLAVGSDDGKEANVWIYALGGTSAMRRLTFGGRNRLPVWSPDGQRVVFQSDREGSVAIFLQRVDGTGGVERLTTPDKDDVHIPESWSPDARHLTFSAVKGGVFSLWVLALADGKITPFGDVRSVEPIGSVFSPDGRWIAYHARSPGAEQLSPNAGVFVEPFPASGTGARNQAPRVAFDFQPLWSRTGKELFYVPTTASGRLAAVRIATETGLTFGIPESLPFTLTAGRTSGATRAFDVLPDGRFVGLVAGSGEGPSREIRLVFNWTEELKRLVPTR